MLQNLLIKLFGTLDTLKNYALSRDCIEARIPTSKNAPASQSRVWINFKMASLLSSSFLYGKCVHNKESKAAEGSYRRSDHWLIKLQGKEEVNGEKRGERGREWRREEWRRKGRERRKKERRGGDGSRVIGGEGGKWRGRVGERNRSWGQQRLTTDYLPPGVFWNFFQLGIISKQANKKFKRNKKKGERKGWAVLACQCDWWVSQHPPRPPRLMHCAGVLNVKKCTLIASWRKSSLLKSH